MKSTSDLKTSMKNTVNGGRKFIFLSCCYLWRFMTLRKHRNALNFYAPINLRYTRKLNHPECKMFEELFTGKMSSAFVGVAECWWYMYSLIRPWWPKPTLLQRGPNNFAFNASVLSSPADFFIFRLDEVIQQLIDRESTMVSFSFSISRKQPLTYWKQSVNDMIRGVTLVNDQSNVRVSSEYPADIDKCRLLSLGCLNQRYSLTATCASRIFVIKQDITQMVSV